ncbi:MAG: methionine--tRNA ligase subunit beta [Patescibacteria group bacterium]
MEGNEQKQNITYSDFEKLDLRVAKIIAAEAIETSEKLMKLSLDVGGESRQIVAGIKKYYSSEELIGKYIVIVANLEPRKLMGEESRGMLLAAGDHEHFTLVTPEREINSGTQVR